MPSNQFYKFLVVISALFIAFGCSKAAVTDDSTTIHVLLIDTTSLVEYDILEFESSLSSSPGILLLDKKLSCLTIEDVSIGKPLSVELKRLYTYVPPDGEIGLQLNGRFDVQVDGRDTTYTFLKHKYVYKCR